MSLSDTPQSEVDQKKQSGYYSHSASSSQTRRSFFSTSSSVTMPGDNSSSSNNNNNDGNSNAGGNDTPLLSVKDVSCPRPDCPGESIFCNASFVVNEGDVLVLRARSGVGKTTLLKCLAHLNLYKGTIEYRGKTPMAYGVPLFRTHVQYVPQRPSLLPKTPRDFVNTLNSFKSRRKSSNKKSAGAAAEDIMDNVKDIGNSWGIEDDLWDRNWNTLSGGESQRIALAIALGLDSAEILLLDEPTSALDATTSDLVEKTLLNEVKNPEANLKALIWITHSEEQALRVSNRTIQLTPTGVEEELIPEV